MVKNRTTKSGGRGFDFSCIWTDMIIKYWSFFFIKYHLILGVFGYAILLTSVICDLMLSLAIPTYGIILIAKLDRYIIHLFIHLSL